jgi:phytoene dehydrogenase-like protein
VSATGPRSSYEVVIVGGGHNGLVAAAYLARAGVSTLLLERRGQLGGAAVSEQAFPGVGARLSRYSYLVSLLPQQIVDELGIELRLARRPVSSYTPDPRAGGARGLLVDERDPRATAASFQAVSDGAVDLGGWQSFYAMTQRAAGKLFGTLTEPLRSRAQLRALLDDEPAWQALFERPIGATVDEAFADDLVRGVVLTDALIGTFASTGELAANRCFLYHVIGRGSGDWLVPVGGMGAVTDALIGAAHRAGAELRADAEVLSIDADDDEGGEVRFTDAAGKEQTVAARWVLANVAPAELERLRGRSSHTDAPEGAQLKVNMVLARLPRLRDERVTPEQAFSGTFHVNELASQLASAHTTAAAGEMPAPAPCESYCHSLTDPSILAPELRERGVQTMTVFALHTPARLFREQPDEARQRALASTLRSLDSVLAEPIEGCLLATPEGEPCIEVRSPLDIEHELRMPAGHIFHRPLSWPFAESDEEVGRWGVETGEPAVLLCGAGARRGGGVSGIPGRNAAMAVLEAR